MMKRDLEGRYKEVPSLAKSSEDEDDRDSGVDVMQGSVEPVRNKKYKTTRM